jgi:DNA repair protein SbcD/Mre11
MALRIAHLSDTHLGFEQYAALSASGDNQRGIDVVRAMKNVVDDIVSWAPDLVIHSGDVLERPKTDLRYMVAARTLFRRLAKVCPVVVIAGNHELPRSRREVCWLDLLEGTENLHVASTRYEVIRPRGLDGVAVHAVPHDVLKEIDQRVIEPVDGEVSILTAHGVASGSELFLRSLGREYAIDEDTLLRGWDYGALGHWHRQGPVSLGAAGVVNNVWYAGSTENMGFRDLRDGDRRGYLRVVVDDAGLSVSPVHLPIRPMFRLPVIDGAGLNSEGLVEALVANLKAADLDGAVVGQIVTGVGREQWSLVDVGRAKDLARASLHYEITLKYPTAVASEGPRLTTVDAFDELISDLVADQVPEDLRAAVLAKARNLIGSDRGHESSTDGDAGPAPDGGAVKAEVAA